MDMSGNTGLDWPRPIGSGTIFLAIYLSNYQIILSNTDIGFA